MTMDRCPKCEGTGLKLPVCIRNCAFTIIFECSACHGTGRYPYPVDMLRLQQHADGTAGEPS